MRKYLKNVLISIIFYNIFSQITVPCFAQTAEPYTKDEFPQILKDLRRAEIVTLGSMPFITFSVSLGWSFGRYAYNGFDSNYFVNPFSKTTTNNFTTDEQIGIILTSLGISVGIGLTDYVYHVIKRNQKTKKIDPPKGKIIISPVQEDPQAQKLPPPPPDIVKDKNNDDEDTFDIIPIVEE